jgi:serine/threonine-protein kinase HipA
VTQRASPQEYHPRTENKLFLVYNSILIGEITRKKNNKYALRYYDSVTGETWFTALSIGLPKGAVRHDSDHIRWWLAALLPDRPPLLMRWRKEFGVTDLEPFELLKWVGEDIAGAFQLVRDERLDTVLKETQSLTPLSHAEIASRLAQAKADIPIKTSNGRGRFSLPGAQAKVALNRTAGEWFDPEGRTPSTHILKPAVPGYIDQDLCEFMTMTAAQLMGLVAAESAIRQFEEERAFVSKRYDRIYDSEAWIRVHQEDICQAMGRDPYFKYESQGGPGAAGVARLLRDHCSDPETDCQRFTQALIFNWLICGGDAHSRNYSLLLVRDEVRLAPLYDLNGQLAFGRPSEVDLAMSINGKFEAVSVTTRDWLAFADRLFVDAEWLAEELARQISVLPDVIATTATLPAVSESSSSMPGRYVDAVAEWCISRADV